MPRPRRQTEETTEIVQFRLDRETAAYYRKRAQQNGMSLSEFLRNKIVQGMISDSAAEVEERLVQLAAKFGDTGVFGDEVTRAVFMCEAMLSAIVEAKSPQALYEAHDAAKAKYSKLIKKNVALK